MTEQRIILALGRLERALSKIEILGTGPATRNTEDGALQSKYDRLVFETRRAVTEMDQLLNREDAHG